MHFDVDVLDDAIMPAVDYRHEGGLSWDEAAQLLQGLLSRPGACGLEVTIYNPNLDSDRSIARQLCGLIGQCAVNGTVSRMTSAECDSDAMGKFNVRVLALP